jgi:bifunctional DNA-binding transcriptional regulator/antitoxin component of YhaV-PrlF toxin-antitoxin module
VNAYPRETLQRLNLEEGSEVNVVVDQEEGRIIIERAHSPAAGVDAEFARQLNDFIEEYRPALEALQSFAPKRPGPARGRLAP